MNNEDRLAEALLPCPFCGLSVAHVTNTHTPKFWVECDESRGGCGAQIDGEYFDGPQRNDIFSYDSSPDYEPGPYEASHWRELHAEYQRAYHSAVNAWNRRPAHEAGKGEVSDAEVAGFPVILMLRDTGLHDDMGGLGQRIFTTAGAGYKKVKYIRADVAASNAGESHE